MFTENTWIGSHRYSNVFTKILQTSSHLYFVWQLVHLEPTIKFTQHITRGEGEEAILLFKILFLFNECKMSMSLEENHFKTTKHGWENVSLLVCSGNVDTKDHTAPWFYNICSLLKKVIFDDEYLGWKKNCQATFKKIVCLHSSTLYWFIYQFHFMFIYQLIKRINYKLGKDTPTSSFDENEYMYSKYIYLSRIQRKTFFREIYIEYKAFWYCGTIYI